jgi:hypothetical protein
MDSERMIYVPSFIKIGSGIQKILRETHIEIHTHIHTQPHRQQGDLISVILRITTLRWAQVP